MERAYTVQFKTSKWFGLVFHHSYQVVSHSGRQVFTGTRSQCCKAVTELNFAYSRGYDDGEVNEIKRRSLVR